MWDGRAGVLRCGMAERASCCAGILRRWMATRHPAARDGEEGILPPRMAERTSCGAGILRYGIAKRAFCGAGWRRGIPLPRMAARASCDTGAPPRGRTAAPRAPVVAFRAGSARSSYRFVRPFSERKDPCTEAW